MRRWIRGSVLFATGLLLGMVTIKSIEAQQDKGIGVRVNHVGIYVKNLQESIDFYTRTLGMREGFVMRDKSGNPTTMYVQVDKYTFLELAQAKMSGCLAYLRTSCRETTHECSRNISWTSWQISKRKNRRCGPKPLLCFANTRIWRVRPRGAFRRAFRAATLITTFHLKSFKHAE